MNDLQRNRTCKHLQALRGHKAELGRVGEEGLKRSEATMNKLLEKQEKQRDHAHAVRQHRAHPAPSGGAGQVGTPPVQPGGQHGEKRRAESLGGEGAAKRPNTDARP